MDMHANAGRRFHLKKLIWRVLCPLNQILFAASGFLLALRAAIKADLMKCEGSLRAF